MKQIPIIIDTDPGHDDAFALMLAIAHEKINLLGITTVAGNSPIENTTLNALRILEKVGHPEIPVARGCGKPLCKELEYSIAKIYHGENGLEGPSYDEVHTEIRKEDAVEFIAETLRKSDEKVTLVPIGPLTNIALLILTHPEVLHKIERIDIMGGLTYANPNGATAASEYNVYQDPEAAAVVFNTGIPMTMHTINSTGLGKIRDSHIETMRTLGKAGVFGAELMDFYKLGFQKLGLTAYNICDSHAVAWLIDPTIYGGREAFVTVDVKGKYTRAMTVCDFREEARDKRNCLVIENCDEDRYYDLVFECLKKLG